MAGFTIDIELTNRCNARCVFCPRDAMPEQGFMRHDVFEQSLARTLEIQALARRLPHPLDGIVTFCGTGEPLLHGKIAEYVRCVRDSGLACEVSTNGSLLSRERALELLEAGLEWVNVNVSDVGADYDRVYDLPFTRTRENVERFIALARDRCKVCIIVVDHRRDATHLRSVEGYWRSRGADYVVPYGLTNRGGSLRLPAAAVPIPDPDDRSGEPELPLICPAPFYNLFIGWDWRYYLCSHDWHKEVAFGSVFETSFAEITAAKLASVRSRKPVCERCALDPANLLRRRRMVDDSTLSRPFGTSVEELVFNDAVARAIARDIADLHAQRDEAVAGDDGV